MNFNNLGFEYIQTKSFIKYCFKNGQWDSGSLESNPMLPIHLSSTCLNYGQSCFEGLKAFQMKDMKVRIFRPQLNAKRLQSSCRALTLESVPENLFLEALIRVVKDNIEYVPPFGTNGSLYIRPVVLGTEPQIGLSPSSETTFIIFVIPVGTYYAGGIGNPVKALIQHGFDRAAPNGNGNVKVGGNYAPCLGPTINAKNKGYTITLFLDSKENKYVEEFSTSNFAALTKPDSEGKRIYVTPKSSSILPSITNRSLAELGRRCFGWTVERRVVSYDELKSGSFQEIAACGTAVVITPIGEIHREIVNKSNLLKKQKIHFNSEEERIWEDDVDEYELETEEIKLSGEIDGFKMLYDTYRDLQTGELENWNDFKWLWPEEGIF